LSMNTNHKEFRSKILEEIEQDFALHHTYQHIAESSLQSALAINQIRKKEIKVKDSADLKEIFREARKSRDILHGCIKAIVFSAMALEALINYYILHIAGADEFNRKYKNRSLKDKWLNAPQELKGIKFDEESEKIVRFKTLVDSRNNLVHFKSKKLKGTEYIKIYPDLIKQAKIAIISLKEMQELLNQQDPPLVSLLTGLEIWEIPNRDD